MAKHFTVTITDDSLTVERKQDQIREEARLDGIYVIRTPVPADDLDAAGVVTAYKNLKYVERDFRHIKSDDLDLRPVFHRLEQTRQGPRADLHARRLPGLAPAPGLGAADLHRRGTPRAREPRRPRAALGIRRGESLPPARRRTAAPTSASAACSPTWAPSPATSCASPAPPPPSPSSPSPPANSARPSSSSGRPSRSPCASSQEPPPGSARKRRPAAVSASKPPVTSA